MQYILALLCILVTLIKWGRGRNNCHHRASLDADETVFVQEKVPA